MLSLTFGLGLLLAQASLIILPGEAGAAVRASASLDAKNCLFHALARTYAHFFTSILYVNFQFGSNEYILIVWHSSSLVVTCMVTNQVTQPVTILPKFQQRTARACGQL